MKNILFILFSLISLSSYSQKCKFDYEKKDPMTDNMIRRIDIKITKFSYLSFFKNGDTLLISQSITFGGEHKERIEMGAELKLKLNDNSFLLLKSIKPSSPIAYVDYGVLTRYTIEYSCTKSDITRIAELGFSAFSYTLNSNTNSVELTKKNVLETISGANCILKN